LIKDGLWRARIAPQSIRPSLMMRDKGTNVPERHNRF
jgi:hypothetical protein